MVLGIVNVREAKEEGADCFTAFPTAEKSMGWRVVLIAEIRGRKREDWRTSMQPRNGFTFTGQITHYTAIPSRFRAKRRNFLPLFIAMIPSE